MSQQKVSSSRLKWVDRVSRVMDSKFVIPGTSIRFGIDPIIGLIPGIGDLGSYGISLALIYTMYQHGASGMLIARMLINASLDAIFGSIPILGSLFDFWFKANDRNVKLLREHYEEGKHTGSGKGLIAIVLIVVFLIAAALLFFAVKFMIALFEFTFQ
ncbi:DUF4112 domain-containing protein [Marinoscillum pacificum]|uniref:DUF4112 domain-containing protein n=1 Tax=Marinoscillum pacificum TaxID=392723 RepID=UPI00215840FF|nr:DUF4112 domain-containing protein [Marinoscillum pacificum]